MVDIDTSQTIVLGNSIIGVSILALPFAFQKCGILLAILTFLIACWINKSSCRLLIRSAVLTKTNSYEDASSIILGFSGCVITQISLILFLFGICSAYLIVIGDLVPEVFCRMFGLQDPKSTRTWVLLFFCSVVILPLSFTNRIERMNRASTLCVIFYILFTLKIFFEALPKLAFQLDQIFFQLTFWHTKGLLNALPIIALSLTCQTQLFLVYQALSHPNQKRMARIYNNAIDTCTLLYILVGLLGYIAFAPKLLQTTNIKADITAPLNGLKSLPPHTTLVNSKQDAELLNNNLLELKGDILINLNANTQRNVANGQSSLFSLLITDLITIGFALSCALSFPLSLLPCKQTLMILMNWSNQYQPNKITKNNVIKRYSSINDITSPIHITHDSLISLDEEAKMPIYQRKQQTSNDHKNKSNSPMLKQPLHFSDETINDSLERVKYFGVSLNTLITVLIVTSTLMISIVLPNIEDMLNIIGTLMGTLISCIIPALMYLTLLSKSRNYSHSMINSNNNKANHVDLFSFDKNIDGSIHSLPPISNATTLPITESYGDKRRAQILLLSGIIIVLFGMSNYIPIWKENEILLPVIPSHVSGPENSAIVLTPKVSIGDLKLSYATAVNASIDRLPQQFVPENLVVPVLEKSFINLVNNTALNVQNNLLPDINTNVEKSNDGDHFNIDKNMDVKKPFLDPAQNIPTKIEFLTVNNNKTAINS